MADAYTAYRATGVLEKSCPLCVKTPIKQFKFWKIVVNDFPYDRIAERHDMIVSLRHATEQELTPEERDELYEVKYSNMQEYDIIVEATPQAKSIPTHFHLHLINTK